MKVFLILICGFALVSMAPGVEGAKEKEQKKAAQAGAAS
jgi:Putative peptidoglycan binding domain